MTEIDRRAFLRGTGSLALGTWISDTAMAKAADQGAVTPGGGSHSPQPFDWMAPNLVFSFDFLDNRLRSRYLLPTGVAPLEGMPAGTNVSGLETEICCTGENVLDHHGLKLTGGLPGDRLIFVGREEIPTPTGKQLVITHSDLLLGLKVESFYESFADVPVVRRHTRISNAGAHDVGIEYASSAMLYNFAAPRGFEHKLRIHFAYSTWQAEGQWRSMTPSQAGFVDNGAYGLSGTSLSSMGTWSTHKYLPIGMVENTEQKIIWFWQIEHNGSWHWELACTSAQAIYAYIGGPDAQYAQAWKNLRPGDSYETIPVAVGCVRGGFEEAVDALTRYRRAACVPFRGKPQSCPVIFNDYMNCLFGDPTTEKEIPIINAAAKAGCEYYVIDAGWGTEIGHSWSDMIGVWQPSKTRWPGGFNRVLDYIRQKGMVPGLWMEPEAVSIHSPLKDRPDAWFFQRHGRRVIDNNRFFLDFRNSEVVDYLDAVIDRLMGYGLGYIKMDYNADALEGTEVHADSFGQGLLEHNRAVLSWLDGIRERYPQLILENVGAGGGRMDYAMLSHMHIQSSSDQSDYRKYPAVLVGASAAVVPEQLAVWDYPLAKGNPDEASFNMVNAMLLRIHLSGQIATLPGTSFAQVAQGLRVYKEIIRPNIPQAIPFYPLGTPDMTDESSPIAMGMRSPKKMFISVWRLKGAAEVRVPTATLQFRLIYPTDLGIRLEPSADHLRVIFPREYMACILST